MHMAPLYITGPNNHRPASVSLAKLSFVMWKVRLKIILKTSCCRAAFSLGALEAIQALMAKLADNPDLQLYRCGNHLEVSHHTVAEEANQSAQCGYATTTYRRIGLCQGAAHAVHIPRGSTEYEELTEAAKDAAALAQHFSKQVSV